MKTKIPTFTAYNDNVPTAIPNGSVAVTLYHIGRHYGGPEEGGWWYDDPVVAEVYLFRSLRKAKVFLRQRLAEGLPRQYRLCLEYPGLNPIVRGTDGVPVSTRPYFKRAIGRNRAVGMLRDIYRNRELLYTPHYC